jgi:hypothetical protein
MSSCQAPSSPRQPSAGPCRSRVGSLSVPWRSPAGIGSLADTVPIPCRPSAPRRPWGPRPVAWRPRVWTGMATVHVEGRPPIASCRMAPAERLPPNGLPSVRRYHFVISNRVSRAPKASNRVKILIFIRGPHRRMRGGLPFSQPFIPKVVCHSSTAKMTFEHHSYDPIVPPCPCCRHCCRMMAASGPHPRQDAPCCLDA